MILALGVGCFEVGEDGETDEGAEGRRDMRKEREEGLEQPEHQYQIQGSASFCKRPHSLDRIDDLLVSQHDQVLHSRLSQITSDHGVAIATKKQALQLLRQLLRLFWVTLRHLTNERDQIGKKLVRLVFVRAALSGCAC